MAQDKFNSVWVSHSSIGDFLKCPRLYFLHNVYKNDKGRKINITSSALSLGIAVHETLEGLSKYKAEERFLQPLEIAFEEEWKKVSGKQGGFKSEAEEKDAKDRGRNMVLRVAKNPGPLRNKTVKLPPTHNGMPPNFFLSEEENIILNGKIDWLEYVPEDDSIRVIDFKTGRNEEKEDSLQLPIYLLLLNNLQKRKVSGAAYWYLDKDDAPMSVALPDIKKARENVLAVSRKIKTAREKKEFDCPKGGVSEGGSGCFACRPFEKILKGEAEYIGIGGYGQDMYTVL
ncbi:MAG: PD-(D/E)XK nuclease family protein [Candidatus Staskawiczbacteria bacterium]|nr:PD-(D/E)XK nuclease family protein [Candidatus Staskawiczbacteria bacterium]